MKLLKVWSTQRGFYAPVSVASSSNSASLSASSSWNMLGSEGGTSLVWTSLIGALVFGEELPETGKTNIRGKKMKPLMQIGRGLSSYQLFRAVMDLLGRVQVRLYHYRC